MRPQLQLTGFPVPAEEPRPTPEILERLRAWDARGTDGWVVAGRDPVPLSLAECRALVDGPVPAYVPTVRGGGKMHVRMLCIGRHWNRKT